MPERLRTRRFLGRLVLLANFTFSSFLFSGQTQNAWTKPKADIRMEFGIDSAERKFYRPEFKLSWPLGSGSNNRFFIDLDYNQRINSRLQGTIDFWLAIGFEKTLAAGFSIEPSLSHFCRHQTSTDNPYILNLNELVGRLWWTVKNARIGFGAGTYLGGSPGFDSLAIFNLNLPRLLADEISLASEWKWVNFEEILYEAGLFVTLFKGTDLFFRAAKHYRFPATSYLGLRFRSDGALESLLDYFKISAGVYPFYSVYKLTVQGETRIEYFKDEQRRFFLNVDFQSPILNGDGFFAQSWPDRMLYALTAEYERRATDDLRVAWYARYVVDMPADKAEEFQAGLASGIAVRNLPDFDKLDAAVRFELAAGYHFKRGYDLGLKLGINTTRTRAPNIGSEFRCRLDREQQAVEWVLFMDFGREISLRPFIGLKKITFENGPSNHEPFKRQFIAGIAFARWF